MTYPLYVDALVKVETSRFDDEATHYWRVCCDLIAEDPHPRNAIYADTALPARTFRSRAFMHEIGEQFSISGEQLFTFTAEFFAEWVILYTIDETEPAVDIIYLRPSP